MRDSTCGDCPHYAETQQYEAARRAPTATPDKHFTILLNPKVEAAVDAALALAEQGDLRRAGDALVRLLREHPRDHLVRYGLGTLHALKGEHQEAIRYFDQAIAIYPYFVEAHYNRAGACRQQVDLAGAVSSLRKVIEISDPNDDLAQRARSQLADLTALIRRIEGVELGIYLESQESFNRAFALLEKGDWPRALIGFRASIAKHERNAPSHGNLALCLAKLGRKKEALAELDRALEINPGYEPAKFNRAAVERMQEGRPLETAEFKSINYSQEKFLREGGR